MVKPVCADFITATSFTGLAIDAMFSGSAMYGVSVISQRSSFFGPSGTISSRDAQSEGGSGGRTRNIRASLAAATSPSVVSK